MAKPDSNGPLSPIGEVLPAQKEGYWNSQNVEFFKRRIVRCAVATTASLPVAGYFFSQFSQYRGYTSMLVSRFFLYIAVLAVLFPCWVFALNLPKFRKTTGGLLTVVILIAAGAIDFNAVPRVVAQSAPVLPLTATDAKVPPSSKDTPSKAQAQPVHAPAVSKSPPSTNVGITGSDTTQVNDTRPINGEGNTILGPTDSHGNAIFTRPAIVGRDVHSGPGDLVYGVHAGTNVPKQMNSPPASPTCIGENCFQGTNNGTLTQQVNNFGPAPAKIIVDSVEVLAPIPKLTALTSDKNWNQEREKWAESLGLERHSGQWSWTTANPGLRVTFSMTGYLETEPDFHADCDQRCVVTGIGKSGNRVYIMWIRGVDANKPITKAAPVLGN